MSNDCSISTTPPVSSPTSRYLSNKQSGWYMHSSSRSPSPNSSVDLPTSNTSLADLPDLAILEISGILTTKGMMRSAASLNTACKSIRDITLKDLWKTVLFPHDFDWRNVLRERLDEQGKSVLWPLIKDWYTSENALYLSDDSELYDEIYPLESRTISEGRNSVICVAIAAKPPHVLLANNPYSKWLSNVFKMAVAWGWPKQVVEQFVQRPTLLATLPAVIDLHLVLSGFEAFFNFYEAITIGNLCFPSTKKLLLTVNLTEMESEGAEFIEVMQEMISDNSRFSLSFAQLEVCTIRFLLPREDFYIYVTELVSKSKTFPINHIYKWMELQKPNLPSIIKLSLLYIFQSKKENGSVLVEKAVWVMRDGPARLVKQPNWFVTSRSS